MTTKYINGGLEVTEAAKLESVICTGRTIMLTKVSSGASDIVFTIVTARDSSWTAGILTLSCSQSDTNGSDAGGLYIVQRFRAVNSSYTPNNLVNASNGEAFTFTQATVNNGDGTQTFTYTIGGAGSRKVAHLNFTFYRGLISYS